MSFFTLINCIDGRVQLPLIKYLQKYYSVRYIDLVTEAGPNQILAERNDMPKVQSILDRINFSLDQHHSKGIALAGHFDCKGNAVDENTQRENIVEALKFLKGIYQDYEVIGLWVNRKYGIFRIIV